MKDNVWSAAFVRSCRPQTAQDNGEGMEEEASRHAVPMYACLLFVSVRVLGVVGEGALIITR